MARSVFLVIFGVLWTGFSVFFVWVTGREVVRQVETSTFVPARAVVEESQVTSRRGSKGKTHYSWSVQYAYDVGGSTYHSRRQKFTGAWSSTNSAVAQGRVSACPVGSTIEAFYDQNDPATSVLYRGAETVDFLPPAFALGFVFGGFAMVVGGVRGLTSGAVPTVAGGLPIVDDGERVSVSLSGLSPTLAGAIAGGVAVVGGTVLNGALTGSSLMLVTVGEGLVFVLSGAIGVVAGMWTGAKKMAPDSMMVFDRRACTLTLPKNEGRKDFVVMSCEIIEEFRQDTYQTKGSKGGTTTHYRVNVDVVGADGSTVRHKVRTFASQKQSDSFTAWCQERLLESFDK